MTERDSAWIRRYHPAQDAAHRLVCFPHAGGAATYYFPVSRALSPDIDVFAIQYPGRQDRHAEPSVDSIDKLADVLVRELRPWLDRPTAFFGHSMGATLAFEVARRLDSLTTSPTTSLTTLFVSGRRAPARVRDERAHELPDDQLVEEIRGLAGTDAGVLADEDLVRMILPAVRADYRAIETYRYSPGPDVTCPIHALTGDADPKVTVDDAAAWEGYTSGDFQLHVFPGGHFYLNDHVDDVLAVIREHLAG